MRAFFDTSAWLKIYVREPGTDRLFDISRTAEQTAICIICIPEAGAAMNRLRREGRMTAVQYESTKRTMFDDVLATVVIELTPDVLSTSFRLVENHPLRGMDALHLAAAIEWRADLFVAADQRLCSVAALAGLKVEMIA